MASLALFVVLAALGFLVVAQLRTQGDMRDDLGHYSMDELGMLVGTLSGDVDRLQQQEAQLHVQSIGSLSAFRVTEEAAGAALATIQDLALVSGAIPARGPGIRLDIDDPDDLLTVYELNMALNELRAAGAEAISLNGVRIGFDSWFGGDAGALVCDGMPLTAPYAFAAVGRPDTLQSALEVAGGLVSMLTQLPAVDARVAASTEIEIPPLHEASRAFEYARPAE